MLRVNVGKFMLIVNMGKLLKYVESKYGQIWKKYVESNYGQKFINMT